MCRQLRRIPIVFAVVTIGLLGGHSRVRAVDTMADWTGENNMTAPNNYSVISDTSAGGTFQSRVNHTGGNLQTFYLSDPTLTEVLDYSHELHMSGTVTFSAPLNQAHNWFFGWYNSNGTNHRIGLGVQGTTPAENNKIRFDFGYAGVFTPAGNFFSSVTSDGSSPNPTPADFVTSIPNGTYPFTFDYVPGDQGLIKATVGTFFRNEGPVPKTLTDLTEFDRFGFVQRSTGILDPTITFSLVMSNVTYTGGSPVEIPGDVNFDGFVDIFDINLVSANWASPGGPTGDANHDGNVNIFDINLISAHWAPHPGSASAVPEPSSVALASLGLIGMCAVAWRRRAMA